MKRLRCILKGIFIGVLVCVLLESIAILVLTFLTSRGIMRLEGWVGTIDYFAPLIAFFVVSALIGLEIARNSRDFKKVFPVFSVILTLILGANYLYFWWWWDSNLHHLFNLGSNPLDTNI